MGKPPINIPVRKLGKASNKHPVGVRLQTLGLRLKAKA